MKNLVYVWRYGAIKPSSSIEIASEYNASENSEFCEDMSKSKNANRETLIIYPLTKMSYFSEFLSWIMQNTRKGRTRGQNIDSYKEISFLSKIYCFYQKRK